MKNKGIKSGAIITDTNTKVNFDEYKKLLFKNEHNYVNKSLIRTKSHILYSTKCILK